MPHETTIIVERVVVQGGENEPPEMTANVVYRPPHTATPQEVGKMVTRLTKRLAKLADDGDD